jgi:SprT protein
MKTIDHYLPENALPRVRELLETHDFILKIVNERSTKHGDFRKLKSGKYQITINNNLNPFQFLLTLIHEIAHHVTHQKYGRVKPHGKEWKLTFKQLMLPFLDPAIYPKNLLPPLAKYLINPKASTDSDPQLSLAMKCGQKESHKKYKFELKLGSTFVLKAKSYRILEKKRTRYLCSEIDSHRKYLISQNAEVVPING